MQKSTQSVDYCVSSFQPTHGAGFIMTPALPRRKWRLREVKLPRAGSRGGRTQTSTFIRTSQPASCGLGGALVLPWTGLGWPELLGHQPRPQQPRPEGSDPPLLPVYLCATRSYRLSRVLCCEDIGKGFPYTFNVKECH